MSNSFHGLELHAWEEKPLVKFELVVELTRTQLPIPIQGYSRHPCSGDGSAISDQVPGACRSEQFQDMLPVSA